MRFGTRKAESKFTNDNDFLVYLRNFREGDNKVRFIDEIDDWIAFAEHYTAEGKSFPCTMDRDTCPGCTSDDERMQKASRKYATNLLLLSNDLVLPFRVPMSLAKKLFNRAERNGTITNRDYIVMREGKGLSTEYDLEQDDKYPVDLDTLRSKAHDIENVLATAYNDLWGDVKPVEEPKQVEKKPPFDQSDAEEVISEESLRGMKRSELILIAEKHNIDYDEDGSKREILESILSQAD